MADDQGASRPEGGGGGDPTWVRNQPALRTARRRQWLIPGVVLAAVAVGMLIATLQLQVLVPTIGIVLVVGCLIAMVLVATLVADPRRRDVTFAWLMGAMTVAALTTLSLVVLGEMGG